MEVDGLGVAGVDLQRPLAVGRLAELFDDCGAKRREKFLGDVPLNVADQVVNKPGCLLLADPLLFGIAIARVT